MRSQTGHDNKLQYILYIYLLSYDIQDVMNKTLQVSIKNEKKHQRVNGKSKRKKVLKQRGH